MKAQKTAREDAMQILIVDDSKTSRTLLGSHLENAGYTDLLNAESAAQAFHILDIDDSSGDDSEIDLILLDLVMPDVNGIEALAKIQSNPRLKDIPVIIVTGDAKDANLTRAFQAGATDFIAKPVKKVELWARVGAALRLKKEIDTRKARERELEALSNLDGLTGIANRRHFDQVFTSEWQRAQRDQYPLALLMADIDFFKKYNDTYGHQAGDDCLRQVAQVLHDILKRPADMSARYGGEEFVIIMPNTSLTGAAALAKGIRAAMASLNIEHSASVAAQYVTLSMGVACEIPGPEKNPNDLIKKADQGLYQAKESGRNQVGVIRANCK